MNRIHILLMLSAVVWTATPSSSFAQTFTLLHTFGSLTTGPTNLDGTESHADMILAGDTLYGTAPVGGPGGYGVIFSMKTNGAGFTLLHMFTGGTDGSQPAKDLVLAGGTLYGLVQPGTNRVGYGSIFSMQTNGDNFDLLYTFTDTTNGYIFQPNGGLTLCSNTFYGTAYQGGISNAGTIFSVDVSGNNFKLLHQFTTGAEGKNPLCTLVLTNGMLYGTTRNGVTNINSTVFSIHTDGSDFTVLHVFTNFPAAHTPGAGLVLGGNTLYGTTFAGGNFNGGTVYAINTDGSDFSILHSFNSSAGEGKLPEDALILNGNTLYGTTLGGSSGLITGRVFAINTDGSSFTLLYSFPPQNNFTNSVGSQPYSSVVRAGNVLYGTTMVGGLNGQGTIYSVAIVPAISNISMMGTNLVFNAVNGISGQNCSVLTSPDLSLPLNEWTLVASNSLSGGGDFTITTTNAVSTAAPVQFYTLKMQ